MHFENTGWSRLDYSDKALDRIGEELSRKGISVEDYDVSAIQKPFFKYLDQPAYEGEYRIYGGDSRHCLLEKALEHFISFDLINPRKSMVGIDIGSCRSVVPEILRKQYGVKIYEQDLTYPQGVKGDKIGSSAASIPLPDSSVDFMTLHCTFEHFEGTADTDFVKECARLLKSEGKCIILPLYLNSVSCNITGEACIESRKKINFDKNAKHYCVIPEWKNRFGRHYSLESLVDRVIKPAGEFGLKIQIIKIKNLEKIDSKIWLKWILLIQKAAEK